MTYSMEKMAFAYEIALQKQAMQNVLAPKFSGQMARSTTVAPSLNASRNVLGARTVTDTRGGWATVNPHAIAGRAASSEGALTSGLRNVVKSVAKVAK